MNWRAKQRISYYIFFAVLFLIAWGIYFILQYGGYIIPDTPGTVQKPVKIERKYIPTYDMTGEK